MTTMREQVAEAIYYSNDVNAYGDVPLWEELEELSPREREVAFEQGDAAITTILTALAAEAKITKAWIVTPEEGYGPDDYFSEGIGVEVGHVVGPASDWIRTFLPSQTEMPDHE